MGLGSPVANTLAATALGEAKWKFVRPRFLNLLANLQITADQAQDGQAKHQGVVASLNAAYYGTAGDGVSNRLLIGSWGKQTRVRPPRDVDLHFLLPPEVFTRFEQRSGNKQSQLLQELREFLRATYPQTNIRGDGQVVIVPFNTYQIEVAPAFRLTSGAQFICDTNNGGTWRTVDPDSEIASLVAADAVVNGNVRKLGRIFKQWQRACDVPLKSFQIERLLIDYLQVVYHGKMGEFWFDWLIRDCLAYFISRANTGFLMPGSANEWVQLGDAWKSKAETAHARAVTACDYERDNYGILAGIEWQKLFGTMIQLDP